MANPSTFRSSGFSVNSIEMLMKTKQLLSTMMTQLLLLRMMVLLLRSKRGLT
jgi:hypothetical protein